MENIRAAQIFSNGTVACFNQVGRKIAEKTETSVKAFVEIGLKKGHINDTTKVYLPSGKIAEVRDLKKDLGIGAPSLWSRIFRK